MKLNELMAQLFQQGTIRRPKPNHTLYRDPDGVLRGRWIWRRKSWSVKMKVTSARRGGRYD